MGLLLYILLFANVLRSTCLQLRYISCGSTATVHSLTLEPCKAEPCVLQVGHNYTITVSFTARTNEDNAYSILTAEIGAEPFIVYSQSACGRDVSCPIRAGVTQTFQHTGTIIVTNPKRVALKGQVVSSRDMSGHPIICAVVPASIVS